MTAKKSSVDKRISVFRATRTRLEGRIKIRGDVGVSLLGFHARQTATGITAKILGKSVSVEGAWIGHGLETNNSEGSKAVWEREGDKRAMKKGTYGPNSIFGRYSRGPKRGQRILRQPIKVLYGPSVAKIFDQEPGLKDAALTDLNTNLRKNIDSQIKWLLARGAPQR